MHFHVAFVASLLALAATSCAQRITIAEPAANSSIQAGQPFTVTIGESDSLTGRTEVGIAIAYRPCPSGNCPAVSADNGLGDLLLVSPFNPEFGTTWSPPSGSLYENFTITIPEGYTGQAFLDAAHFYVLGASSLPTIDIASINVNIV